MSLCWGWAQQEGLGVWARPGVWRSQRGEEAAEVHEGPGLSGFGQRLGILPSTENVARSAGLGPDQTLTPSVSTSGPEGFGHPAPTLVRVSRGPQSSPPKSHTLWGRGGPQGDFPGFAESAAKGRSPRRAPHTAQGARSPDVAPEGAAVAPGHPEPRLPGCPDSSTRQPPAKGPAQSVLSHHMPAVRPQ